MSNNDTLATIVDRLDQVRRTGRDRYVACCPAHEDSDSTPSLSIQLGDRGQVLLHCFGGCDVGAVMASIGLSLADLYPPRRHRGAGASSRRLNRREMGLLAERDLAIIEIMAADVMAGKTPSSDGYKALQQALARIRDLQDWMGGNRRSRRTRGGREAAR